MIKSRKTTVLFIVLIGIVSLFSDMVYEGARSIAGPFLEILHANAFIVSFFTGLGELLGYALRLVSGYFADKTKKYWTFVFAGYGLNLLSVPLLALAGNWQLAIVFMMGERIGKAVRTPSRDAMLAYATSRTGRGWGFGLHEALDQIGATLGPLMVMFILYISGNNYQHAFAWTLLPAFLALSVLVTAKHLFPEPEKLEIKEAHVKTSGFNRIFWIFMAASSFLALGYADFPLIAFRIKSEQITTDLWIPALYSAAMLSDAFAALILGRLFDKLGLKVLIVASALSLMFAPLVFMGNISMVITGVVLWGIGMGAQESILRAAIANTAPSGKVASAYGIFNTFFGLSWFAGSALMGFLYDHSILALVIFSVVSQASAILILLIFKPVHNSPK